MRFIAPLAFFLLVSFTSKTLAHQPAARLPQSFKIWSDEGKMLKTDHENLVCEIIELEYITKARAVSLVEVSIKNAEGQLMAKRIISSDGGNLRSKIGVNRWPEGVYSLQVWIDGEAEVYPITIVNQNLSLEE